MVSIILPCSVHYRQAIGTLIGTLISSRGMVSRIRAALT